VNTIVYKPIVRVPQVLHLRCNWGWRWGAKFWGQKVKGQSHSKTKYFQISSLEGISYKPLVWKLINFATRVQLATKVNWLDLRSKSQRSRSWWARSWSKPLVNKCALPV